jgi:hypothetical protein
MIPKSGYRFPACAKPRQRLCARLEASAGEGRSEKIMLKEQTKAKCRFNQKSFRFSGGVGVVENPMKFARTIVCLGLAAGWLLLGTAAMSAQEIQISPATSSWSEQKWPFLIDQWGTGQAFDCAVEGCGRELHLYLRAKIGFCRCATGVSDDDEIERVADLDLIGLDYKPLVSGHPVSAGIMSGRARRFAVLRPLQSALPVLTIALSNKCNAIVATVVAETGDQSALEAQALDFLRSTAVQHWVESQQSGSE